MADDMQFRIVPEFEEASGAAFFAAQGVIAVERKERAGSDAARAKQGVVSEAGLFDLQGEHTILRAFRIRSPTRECSP